MLLEARLTYVEHIFDVKRHMVAYTLHMILVILGIFGHIFLLLIVSLDRQFHLPSFWFIRMLSISFLIQFSDFVLNFGLLPKYVGEIAVLSTFAEYYTESIKLCYLVVRTLSLMPKFQPVFKLICTRKFCLISPVIVLIVHCAFFFEPFMHLTLVGYFHKLLHYDYATIDNALSIYTLIESITFSSIMLILLLCLLFFLRK